MGPSGKDCRLATKAWISLALCGIVPILVLGTTWAADVSGRVKFFSRCQSPAVTMCLPLDTAKEIDRFRSTPRHLAPADYIQLDPADNAARFTIAPRSGSDTSGMLDVHFPDPLIDVYVSFDVRYPSEFLRYRFRTGGGWKMFILGQGPEGCAPYEVVGVNFGYSGFPSFYYMCGTFVPVAVQNPYGDSADQFDLQPGGDSQCLMHPRPGSPPCARFVGDAWVTYQVHVASAARRLEVWQTVDGKTTKIIDYSLAAFPKAPPAFEWIKLTPYNTGMEATDDHPPFHIWYRRVIVSTAPIPMPGMN